MENQECIICLDIINEKQNIDLNIFSEKCEHKNSYHDKCINNWINDCVKNKITPSCPLCRNDIKYNILVEPEPNVNIITQDSNNKCQILCCIMTSTIILFFVSITMKNLFMQ